MSLKISFVLQASMVWCFFLWKRGTLKGNLSFFLRFLRQPAIWIPLLSWSMWTKESQGPPPLLFQNNSWPFNSKAGWRVDQTLNLSPCLSFISALYTLHSSVFRLWPSVFGKQQGQKQRDWIMSSHNSYFKKNTVELLWSAVTSSLSAFPFLSSSFPVYSKCLWFKLYFCFPQYDPISSHFSSTVLHGPQSWKSWFL